MTFFPFSFQFSFYLQFYGQTAIKLSSLKSLRLFQFLCQEKNKECFGKPDKFRKFPRAVFLNFDFVFPQVLPEITINKNSNFMQFSHFPPNCRKTRSKLKKTARANFLNLFGFPKHSSFFSQYENCKSLRDFTVKKPHFSGDPKNKNKT